ncbi:MAG TPA: ribonuclease H [Bacteroidetes bacterium]|nr:ribonuclease HI family protein [Ignavibacteria bacterium]HCA43351.1 ribonuclease H [Bacteroidota bacterium]HCN36498.1 ribonuclease H [Bacteroidota bacterium]
MKVLVWTDGASRGNPGKAGIGVSINRYCQIDDYKEYIGIATNNVAEYKALIKAIDILKVQPHDTIIFQSDSELMVNQVNGKYKVKNETLKLLNEEVLKKLQDKFDGRWSIEYIPREKNKDADKLANEAIDESELEKTELKTESEDNFQLNFE